MSDGVFAKRLTNAEELLRQVEGESVEDAIKKWWELNGLDVEQARKNRKDEYAKQRAESLLLAETRGGKLECDTSL